MEKTERVLEFNEIIDKVVNFIYIATVLASISINLFDIFRLINLPESFILYTNIPAIFIILVSFLLKAANLISLRISFAVVVFAILANSYLSIFQSRYLEDLVIALLRESIFIAFLISLSAFVISRKFAFVISGTYCVFVFILYGITNDNYVLENMPILIVIFLAYTFFINYLISILNKTTTQLQGKNILVKEQLEEIETQNEELLQLNEEILVQRDQIENKMTMLEEKNAELVKMHDELKLLNETKNKLFSVIGHDIKNPMHVIIGYSDLLKSKIDKVPHEKIKWYADKISKNIKTLFYLLENILTWSKLQQDNIVFKPEILDLNKIISQSLEIFHENIERKQIKVMFSTDPQLYAFADKDMVFFVIRNLIDNAIKFCKQKGVVQITGTTLIDSINVNIKDNGAGIPDDFKNRIFKINSDVSKSGTKGEQGSGFGLVICKEFIEKNNGSIWFESNEEHGSVFSFALPRQRG